MIAHIPIYLMFMVYGFLMFFLGFNMGNKSNRHIIERPEPDALPPTKRPEINNDDSLPRHAQLLLKVKDISEFTGKDCIFTAYEYLEEGDKDSAREWYWKGVNLPYDSEIENVRLSIEDRLNINLKEGN